MRLDNTIAIDENYIKSLQINGEEILKSAQEVTKEIERYTEKINKKINELPTGVEKTGVQGKIAKAKKEANPEVYGTAAKKMKTVLQDLSEKAIACDKTCAEISKKLTRVTKSLTNRMKTMENLVTVGGFDYDVGTFYAVLEQYKKDWQRESEELAQLLSEIKKQLKGMDVAACMFSKDPVNLSTGNFVYDREDLKIGGAVPISFIRYYNSLEEHSSVLGEKWKHNYEISLFIQEKRVTVWKADGGEESFQKEKDKYECITGSNSSLQETGDGYRYEEKEGEIYVFHDNGRLRTVSDGKGNNIRFSYNEAGRLERTESISGKLFYEYNEDGRLAVVKDHTGRKVLLEYKEGSLHRITTPAGVSYQYSYGMDNNLKCIINPQEVTIVKNRFDKDGRTKKQYFPDGGVMKFSYDDENGTVILTERNGGQITYEHDNHYRNIRTIYEDGEESYVYNRYNQRISYTDKNGNRTVYAYDNMGNLTRIVDAAGNVANFTYGGHAKPIRIKMPDGTEQKYSYDNSGNLLEYTDEVGNVTKFRYNEDGRLAEIKQSDAGMTKLLYDEIGNLIELIKPDGEKLSYVYDDLNRIICTTDENGNTTRYAYDAADRIVCVTNPEGLSRQYNYNASGMVIEIKDFDGYRITRGYNKLNKLEWEADKEGNTTRYLYDLMWNVSKVILPNNGEYIYHYNALNQLESVVNPLGGTIYYQYDKNGNILRAGNGKGTAFSFTYDSLNRRICTTNPMGNERRIYYDSMGRVIRQIDEMQRNFDTIYDENGNKIAEKNAVNGGMAYAYDSMGRVIRMTDGAGRERSYTYDLCGRISKMQDFDGKKEQISYDKKGNMIHRKDNRGIERYYAYDCMDRVTEVTDGTVTLQRYVYDAAGRCISVTEANGSCTKYSYTPNGKLKSITDSEGNKISYAYDGMGHLQTVQYPSSGEQERIIRYERNAAGQIIKSIDALGNAEVYEYDQYGVLTGKTDRKGQTTRYHHNGLGDITHVQYADDNEVFISYDALRQVTELNDWLGSTQVMTDGIGRPKCIKDAIGGRISYEWGMLGELRSIVYPDGQRVRYEYDSLLRLSDISVGEEAYQYIYDAAGRLSEKQYNNGMQSLYTYTQDGRIENLTHRDKEGILDQYQYRYDIMGNCVQEKRTRRDLPEESGDYRYAYDTLGRLVSVVKDGVQISSYVYDAYGNRTVQGRIAGEEKYFYDAANQLIKREEQSGMLDYVYDANGNMLQIIQDGEVKARYAYNSADNMILAETERGIAEYQYNGLGKKISQIVKKKCGETVLNAVKTDYILDYTKDYNNLLQRKRGEQIENYYWDYNLLSATQVKENMLPEESRQLTYLTDMQGSPVRLGSENGKVKASYSYQPFGEELYSIQGAEEPEHKLYQPFGFTGYEKEEISGLYYAQARRYDALTGRFTSRDIVKGAVYSGQSQNEYAYCLGNPLKYVDRDGRKPKALDNNLNEDINDFTDVYYMNAEEGAATAGHAAILLVNKDGEGYYYNMAKDGGFTSFYLKGEDVDNLLKNGEIDPNNKYLDKSQKPYNRYVKMNVTDEQANRMIKEAERHKKDKYNLISNNCTQVATEILNAGGNDYKTFLIPNLMYDYLKTEVNEKE